MTETKTAQDFAVKARTGDVLIEENVDFAGLLLSDEVQLGLTKAGFVRPSPIQLKAIPLGRCGLDLIVQAKSGTGKTCVFTVIALEGLIEKSSSVQVLVLAPTREIAVQIWEVITSIGSCMTHLKCCTFIGGTPLYEDKQKLTKCNVAVGTPGRIKQLIETQIMRTENVRLFVLDEADKLVEESFQEQINWIYSTLPENKQMLALSATYPEVLANHLTAYMRNPTFVRLNSSDPALLGIKQYYKLVKYHPLGHKLFDHKSEALIHLLSSVEFNQCLVFSNYQLRAQRLSEMLNGRGWPATYISGSQEQQDRLAAMASLKQMTCRILISTDLTSRGIDAENVNLVVNLDLPPSHETYLHRIGRAGRFGSFGAAVSFITQGKEMEEFKKLESNCCTHIKELPDPVPADLTRSSGYICLDQLVTTETLHTREETSTTIPNNKTLVPDIHAENTENISTAEPQTVTNTNNSYNMQENNNVVKSERNGKSGDSTAKMLGGKDKENGKRSESVVSRGSTEKGENVQGMGGKGKGGNEEGISEKEGNAHSMGEKGKVEVEEQVEKKPKWKRNDIWTSLSHSYGEECKASEERRRRGKEDDRSLDRPRPIESNTNPISAAKPTDETHSKNTSQESKKNSQETSGKNPQESKENNEKDSIAGSKNEGNLAEGSSQIPQPNLAVLLGYQNKCRDFSEILADYRTFVAGDSSSLDPTIARSPQEIDSKVSKQYDDYIKEVSTTLNEREKVGFDIPWESSRPTGDDVSKTKTENEDGSTPQRNPEGSVKREKPESSVENPPKEKTEGFVEKATIEKSERSVEKATKQKSEGSVEIPCKEKTRGKSIEKVIEVTLPEKIPKDVLSNKKSNPKSNPNDKDGFHKGEDSAVLTESELSSEMFSLKKQHRKNTEKQSPVGSKSSGMSPKSNKSSAQEKHAQIRKYDRRRSPRKINQRLVVPTTATRGEGGASESNSYPESESDYPKDHPSDSLLSENASSANDLKRRPAKKPTYPQGHWVPCLQVKGTGITAIHNNLLHIENEESSSGLIESDEDTYSDTDNEGFISSEEELSVGAAHCDCQRATSKNLVAQYQAMQYASYFNLYSMHRNYADYYKAACENIAREMNLSAAYSQQQDYIRKMAKWMAAKKE